MFVTGDVTGDIDTVTDQGLTAEFLTVLMGDAFTAGTGGNDY
jgi:hypothetical protein